MKKIILFAAILFAGVSVVKADEPVVNTQKHGDATGLTEAAEATLNIYLTSIQSIMVDAKPEVNLRYNTIKEYEDGVNSDIIAGHLNIYSTGGFKVSVQTATDSDEIFNTVGISAYDSDNTLISTKGQLLTQSPVELFNRTTGGVDIPFGINYHGKGLNDYMARRTSADTETTTLFTTTVTYTIAPN